ncbi:hypothetical protein [Tractidigestivibacter sp.]|jgi:hypothetical protein|uniref:hypothetical protein n=1 Tax=Tractidigestivibacter sp. TaxID=2847320 RepID=UPI003D8D8788
MRENLSWGLRTRRRSAGLPNGTQLQITSYGVASDVTSVYFGSLEELRRLLYNEYVLNCCYRLNVEMMRKGSTMFSRFNNVELVAQIFEQCQKGD